MRHAFPCGALPLDFIGTLRARRNEVPTEKLDSIEALEDWFVESGMLDSIRGATDAEWKSALSLRETIHALVVARMNGEILPEDALDAVNRQAASLPIGLRLEADGLARTGTASQALTSLARETLTLLGGGDAGHLRECGRPGCTQIYVDRSRGHRREWCSMKTCGNRVKASAFRARQREKGAAPA